jgi:hypothetical protein
MIFLDILRALVDSRAACSGAAAVRWWIVPPRVTIPSQVTNFKLHKQTYHLLNVNMMKKGGMCLHKSLRKIANLDLRGALCEKTAARWQIVQCACIAL